MPLIDHGKAKRSKSSKPAQECVPIVRCKNCQGWDRTTERLMPDGVTMACICRYLTIGDDVYTHPNGYCWIGRENTEEECNGGREKRNP